MINQTYYLKVALCTWGFVAEGVCRKTPPSVTNLCREMAAQACYKAYVFDTLPYLHPCTSTYIFLYLHLHPYFYLQKACRIEIQSPSAGVMGAADSGDG